MVMHLRPELVDVAALSCLEAPATGFAEPGGVYRWRPICHWSGNGVVGTPGQSSAVKGKQLLDAAAQSLAGALVDGATWADGSFAA